VPTRELTRSAQEDSAAALELQRYILLTRKSSIVAANIRQVTLDSFAFHPEIRSDNPREQSCPYDPTVGKRGSSGETNQKSVLKE
jgi:hypothetical protein